MRKLGMIIIAAVLMLTATACGGRNADRETPAASPSGTQSETMPGTVADSDAEALYQAKCVACHATDLSGGMGPELQTVGSRMSADDIAAIIANGGRGMTAFKGILSDAEIKTLADWLAAKK